MWSPKPIMLLPGSKVVVNKAILNGITETGTQEM